MTDTGIRRWECGIRKKEFKDKGYLKSEVGMRLRNSPFQIPPSIFRLPNSSVFYTLPHKEDRARLAPGLIYMLQVFAGQRVPIGDKFTILYDPDDVGQFAVAVRIKLDVAGYTRPDVVPYFFFQRIAIGSADLVDR